MLSLITMPLRPYIFGIILLLGLVADGVRVAYAQTLTNFATWKAPENAEAVPDWARIMLNREFRNLEGPERETRLAQVLAALQDIVGDADVVPSTRYNAVLAVGQLDSRVGNPPTAYPPALAYLADVYQNADSPAYLKYGALLGIVRHAVCGIEPDPQERIIALLLETAAGQTAESNAEPLKPDVGHWFQCTALDGLTALKTMGPDGKVVSELLALMEQKIQEIELLSEHYDLFVSANAERLHRAVELASKAAKVLGDLDYRSAAGIDSDRMADVFVKLTQAVCVAGCRMITVYLDEERTVPEPNVLKERIVAMQKMSMQSVVWGIRGGFLLPNRPAEHSFYASLPEGDSALVRLDALLTDILAISAFFDEGESSRRSAMPTDASKAFRFDLLELREVLAGAIVHESGALSHPGSVASL